MCAKEKEVAFPYERHDYGRHRKGVAIVYGGVAGFRQVRLWSGQFYSGNRSFFLDFFMRHHIPLHIVGRSAQKGKKGGKRGFWARRIGEYRKFRAWWTVKRRLPVLAKQYDVIIDFHNFFWGSYLHGFSQKRMGFCHVGLGCFNHQLKNGKNIFACMIKLFA